MGVAEGSFLCLGITSGGATTYNPIENCITIDPFERTAPDVDTTGLLSAVKTARPGKIPDMGEISATIQFDATDATHALLEGYANASVVVLLALVFPIGAVGSRPARVFSGYVNKFKFETLEDEKNIEATFTVKVVSTITMTTA